MEKRKRQLLSILKSKVSKPTLIKFKKGWFAGGKPITDVQATNNTGAKIIFTKGVKNENKKQWEIAKDSF